MQESNISWCDYTWNPVHGCSRVSAGCDNCYAERISRKFKNTTLPWTPENADENVTMKPDKLDEPESVTEPAHIFVNSMSDLFHPAVTDEFVHEVFRVMRNCPHHVFQILTKRPGRAAHMDIQWPPNVWIGTSVEDWRVTDRIDLLRGADAALRFVSFEPLIAPVGRVDLSGYDWAIVGGESGPDYRDMDHEWARSIYRQCRNQDVHYYFKQSAAPLSEQGTCLRVPNPNTGKAEKMKIREIPEPEPEVKRARADAGPATLADFQ